MNLDMLTAAEVMQLPQTQLTVDELRQARDALKEIKAHVQHTARFAGVLPVSISVTVMESTNAARAICVALGRAPYKWRCLANLMSVPSRFGGAPTPHHWDFHLTPMEEIYNDLDLSRLSTTASD